MPELATNSSSYFSTRANPKRTLRRCAAVGRTLFFYRYTPTGIKLPGLDVALNDHS